MVDLQLTQSIVMYSNEVAFGAVACVPVGRMGARSYSAGWWCTGGEIVLLKAYALGKFGASINGEAFAALNVCLEAKEASVW